MKHTIVQNRVISLLKVNEIRIYLLALKQGSQKQYGRYGHGLTKIFHILLEINHIVFKKQHTLSFQMNGYTKYQVVTTSLQMWITIPIASLISAADDIILRATLPFQLFLKFSYIFKSFGSPKS